MTIHRMFALAIVAVAAISFNALAEETAQKAVSVDVKQRLQDEVTKLEELEKEWQAGKGAKHRTSQASSPTPIAVEEASRPVSGLARHGIPPSGQERLRPWHEGMLLSLTVAGAVEASHLFPEHLAAGAIIAGAAGAGA